MCDLCGANLALVGIRHHCRPQPKPPMPVAVSVTRKPRVVTDKRVFVTDSVTDKPRVTDERPLPVTDKAMPKTAAQRMASWRRAHGDQARIADSERKRLKRAKAKAAKQH